MFNGVILIVFCAALIAFLLWFVYMIGRTDGMKYARGKFENAESKVSSEIYTLKEGSFIHENVTLKCPFCCKGQCKIVLKDYAIDDTIVPDCECLVCVNCNEWFLPVHTMNKIRDYLSKVRGDDTAQS